MKAMTQPEALSSVAAQSMTVTTVPTRCQCPSSDLPQCPNLQSNENILEQCPMSIFELQCPLELSDQAFKTTGSMSMCQCLGVSHESVPVPVPH